MSNNKMPLLTQALNRYGSTCFWCNHLLITSAKYKKLSSKEKRKYRVATIDHILPQSYGGTDHLKNLRPSCLDCNNARGSGWKNLESEVFPSCPLLQVLERERKGLNIKLSFPDSARWVEKWKDRVEYTIKPHSMQPQQSGKNKIEISMEISDEEDTDLHTSD